MALFLSFWMTENGDVLWAVGLGAVTTYSDTWGCLIDPLHGSSTSRQLWNPGLTALPPLREGGESYYKLAHSLQTAGHAE